MTSPVSLKDLFYQSFDTTMIVQFMDRLAALPETQRRSDPNFLGEGTHFQSFVMPLSPLNLAINVAKASFTNRGTGNLTRWKAAILSLRTIEAQDLIPPLEVVQSTGLVAIVMPRGNPVLRKGADSREVSALLQETSKALGKAGLMLDDYPQLVECRGKLFINDWSDLALSE